MHLKSIREDSTNQTSSTDQVDSSATPTKPVSVTSDPPKMSSSLLPDGKSGPSSTHSSPTIQRNGSIGSVSSSDTAVASLQPGFSPDKAEDDGNYLDDAGAHNAADGMKASDYESDTQSSIHLVDLAKDSDGMVAPTRTNITRASDSLHTFQKKRRWDDLVSSSTVLGKDRDHAYGDAYHPASKRRRVHFHR